MAQAISGSSGRGTFTTYEAPKDFILSVRSVQFGHQASGSGGPHWASVGFADANAPGVFEAVTTVSVPDGANTVWNYGVGMVETKQNPTGDAVPIINGALPDMDLYPGGQVLIVCRQGNGTIDSNAQVTDVIIYGDLIRVEDGADFGVPPLIPGLLYG